MSAVQEALDRASAVAKPSDRYTIEDVDYRGRLIVRARDGSTDSVDGVYEFRGSLLFDEIGRTKEGLPSVHPVRDRGLKRGVRAVLDAPDRDALVREAHAKRSGATQQATRRRVRRGAS